MKKFTKILMSIMMALALCLMSAPAQSAYAADEIDLTTLTEDQLKAIFFSEWHDGDLGIYSFTETEYSWSYCEYGNVCEWTYEGVVTKENACVTAEDYRAWGVYGETPTGTTIALKFVNEKGEYYLYKGYANRRINGECLIFEIDEPDSKVFYTGLARVITGDEGYRAPEEIVDINDIIADVVAGSTSTGSDEVVETTDNLIATNPADDVTDETTSKEDTTDETVSTDDVADETITSTDDTADVIVDDGKEAISKTTDGRPVYEGETVYVVKKGDCLWAIAKQLLGDGRKYTELFTRNNGIIEKAELIFPGQEVIVIAK